MVGNAGPRFAKRTFIFGQLISGGTGSSNAPVVIFRHCLTTAGLQTAGRITSLNGSAQAVVAGVGVAPTEAELMRLA